MLYRVRGCNVKVIDLEIAAKEAMMERLYVGD